MRCTEVSQQPECRDQTVGRSAL